MQPPPICSPSLSADTGSFSDRPEDTYKANSVRLAACIIHRTMLKLTRAVLHASRSFSLDSQSSSAILRILTCEAAGGLLLDASSCHKTLCSYWTTVAHATDSVLAECSKIRCGKELIRIHMYIPVLL
jgi:hypothetical protein